MSKHKGLTDRQKDRAERRASLRYHLRALQAEVKHAFSFRPFQIALLIGLGLMITLSAIAIAASRAVEL